MGRKKQPPLQIDPNGIVQEVPAEPELGAWDTFTVKNPKDLAAELNRLESEQGRIFQILPETATSYPTIVYRKPA